MSVQAWKSVALILLAIAFAVLGILAATHTHVDRIPALDTYGISVGTNTTYASFDVVRGNPEFSYQSGQ